LCIGFSPAMLKVELHIHTSDDPVDPIPYSTCDLIDRAAELEYDALALTLHDKQLDVAPFVEYAAARGIVLIPGIERTIHGRHVLLLNFSSAAQAVHSYEDLARLKARERGIVIAPHPYYPAPSALRGHLNKHGHLFDAVEWNAMFTPFINFNALAERWARKHGKPMVGNCDVHRLEMLGTTYSLVDADPNADAICQAIVAGRVHVVAKPLTFVAAAHMMARLYAGNFTPRLHPEPDPVTAHRRRRAPVASPLAIDI
jgi:predicted metal-dependent phosphoesterase TrpH